MQSVFSRASQAHVCNCRPCAQAANTMIRRSTTATLRRKATASDIFTACYTTILATAAVADAHYKDRRREDLDRQIDEARAGLARLTEESTAYDLTDVCRLASASRIAVPKYSFGLKDAIGSICDRPSRLIEFQRQRLPRRAVLNNVHRYYARAKDPINALGAMGGVNLDSIDESLKVEEQQSDFQHREPLTQSQFSRFTSMINHLVDALLTETYRQDHPDDPEAMRRSLESLDSSWTAMRLLRSEGYPHYSHPGIDPEATRKTRRELSRVTRAIFSEWMEEPDLKRRNKRRKFLVAKICYNFLVSPIPPSIHNYNTLVLGFTRVGESTLSQIVVDSLLEGSRLRPTSQTVVCLLHHYRAKEDIVGFYGIIRRVMALDPRGLLIRRRKRDELNQGSIRAWARDSDVGVSHTAPELLVERPERTDNVYDAMIKGLLSFDRIKDAVKVYVASMIENRSVELQTLMQIVRFCLWHLDKAAASILVRGFLDHPDALNGILTSPNCPTKLPRQIYNLFHLIRDTPQYPPAQTVPIESTPDLRRSFLRLSTILFAKETEKYLTLLSATLRRAKIGLFNSNIPLVDRTSIAISGLRGVERSLKKRRVEASQYGRMMMIHSIHKQCMTTIPNSIRLLEYEYVGILLEALPAQSLKRDVLLSTTVPLNLRLGWYRDRRPDIDPDTVALIVERALKSSAKVAGRLKWTLLEQLPLEERMQLYQTYGNFSQIPLEAMFKARLQPASSPLGDYSTPNQPPPAGIAEFASDFVSRQTSTPSFIGWQMKCA